MSWDKKGGEGLWTEYVNSETNESSIKEHKPKLVKQWCAKGQHDFKIVDISKRLAKCTKCDQELQFIVGKHIIDGNTVKLG